MHHNSVHESKLYSNHLQTALRYKRQRRTTRTVIGLANGCTVSPAITVVVLTAHWCRYGDKRWGYGVMKNAIKIADSGVFKYTTVTQANTTQWHVAFV